MHCVVRDTYKRCFVRPFFSHSVVILLLINSNCLAEYGSNFASLCWNRQTRSCILYISIFDRCSIRIRNYVDFLEVRYVLNHFSFDFIYLNLSYTSLFVTDANTLTVKVNSQNKTSYNYWTHTHTYIYIASVYLSHIYIYIKLWFTIK